MYYFSQITIVTISACGCFSKTFVAGKQPPGDNSRWLKEHRTVSTFTFYNFMIFRV